MSIENDPLWVLATKTTLETVRAYVVAHGWILPEPGADFYVRPNEEGYRGFVNIRNDVRVVPEILDAARAVAYYEKRDVLGVLESFLTFETDRVRCRLISSEIEDGFVPLGAATSFVERVAKIFAASLKDVVKPERFHKKTASSEITELLKVAKFGRTERGSFVVNVYVPLGRSVDVELFKDARGNVFRKSLEHLTTSIDRATKLIDERNPDAFLQENEQAQTTTSANLLEAVDEARIDEDSELEISIDWSKTLPTSAPSRVRINKEHSQFFWKWSAHYRPEKQTSMKEFIAKVVEMRVEDWDDAKPIGTAVLRVVDDEPFEAQAALTANDFQTANQGFMSDRCVVFSGVVERSRNRAVVSSIKGFRLVSG